MTGTEWHCRTVIGAEAGVGRNEGIFFVQIIHLGFGIELFAILGSRNGRPPWLISPIETKEGLLIGSLSNPLRERRSSFRQVVDAFLSQPGLPFASVLSASLADIERQHIEATLKSTEWNKSKTSELLGIERSTLDRKIKRYELKRPS